MGSGRFMSMSHSFSQIYIHVVWTVKNREPLLYKKLRYSLYSYILEKAKASSIDLVALGGVEDHLHLLIRLPTSKAIADVVKYIKGASAYWLNTINAVEGIFQWQNGYSAFSVSPQRIEKVKQYILNQEQHHQSVTYEEEVKMFNQ